MTAFVLSAGINNRTQIAQNLDFQIFGSSFRRFPINQRVQQHQNGDGFEQLNMACIVRFIKSFDEELASHPDSELVVCVDP